MDAPGMSSPEPVSVSQLAQHTSSDSEHLYRLLRYLAGFGLFEECPGQCFRLTSMGQLLRADHPSGLCYAAVAFGEPGHYMPWMHLDKAVQQGAPGCMQQCVSPWPSLFCQCCGASWQTCEALWRAPHSADSAYSASRADLPLFPAALTCPPPHPTHPAPLSSLLAGKCAFEFFQPDLPGGAFQYMSLSENKAEEEVFNRLMTTFTKTMDVGITQLHVRAPMPLLHPAGCISAVCQQHAAHSSSQTVG